MPQSNAYFDLLKAFDAARDAYLRLEQHGPTMSDAQLARDADYAQLFHAGRSIAYLGGAAAIDAVMHALFPQDPRRALLARHNLAHWWAGFGQWNDVPAMHRQKHLC